MTIARALSRARAGIALFASLTLTATFGGVGNGPCGHGDGSGSPANNACQPGDDRVPLSDPQVATWSNARFVSYLARQHGLAVVGENPGGDNRSQLPGIRRLAGSCGFSGLEWAWDSSFTS